jgi:hypothetical protein
MRILDLQRHNMTKTQNKIPAKISDFTVSTVARNNFAAGFFAETSFGLD